jgi:uncharacterized protein
MKVRLEKEISIAAPAQAVWDLLRDLEATAGCMPGAKITERIDESHHRGTVTVRLGPATLAFRGEIEVRDVDPAARSLRLVGKGTDTSGTSAASMDLSARVEADGAQSRLVGVSETTVSGKAATFGGRLMNPVADQLLAQFAANFAARAAAASAPPAGPGEAPAPAAAEVPRELNGLALAWAVLRNWLRGLFGRKAA